MKKTDQSYLKIKKYLKETNYSNAILLSETLNYPVSLANLFKVEAINNEDDIELAIKLMTVAHLSKPENPLFKKKLDDYKVLVKLKLFQKSQESTIGLESNATVNQEYANQINISKIATLNPHFSFDELNTYVYTNSVRLYQYLIINNLPFFLNIEEIIYTYEYCKAFNGVNHIYFRSTLRTNKIIILISFRCGKGYMLSEYNFISNLDLKQPKNDTVVIMSGHNNFAHFLWNQFDALCKFNQELLLYQPINTIFEVKNILKNYKSVDKNTFDNSPSIYLGSQYIGKETLKKIHTFLKLNEKKSLKKKIIYLGVRGPGKRAIVNEVEFYTLLIKELAKKFNHLSFYIDGFSFQNDKKNNPKSIERSNNILLEIDKILSNINKCNIEVIHGLHLHEFWNIIGNIDFYVTHAGTMQHKIAWLFPKKDGLILVGGKNPHFKAKWHASQVYSGHIPKTLDNKYFEVLNNLYINDRDKQLKIVNTSEAVIDTIEILKKYLENT